jgi:signal peptidase II
MQTAGGASLNDDATEPETPGPPTPHRPRGVLLGFSGGVAALVILADQITKLIALNELSDRAPIELFNGLLTLVLVRNGGAAFGMGSAFTPILVCFVLIVVAVVGRLTFKAGSVVWAVTLGLVLGGAFGNLIDRFFRDPGVMRGHVVDFLQLPYWPVFNLADTSICVAVGLVVLLTFTGRRLDGTREVREVREAREGKE